MAPRSKSSERFDGQFLLRESAVADTEEITRINDSEIPNVTAISAEDLIKLSHQAFHFRVVESPSGKIAGFVLALHEKAIYSSLNFMWFKARYPRFSYVDRIVIYSPFQGLGLGRRLYEDLQRVAVELRSPILSCEVNIRPPNPASLNFHRQFGFREVGVQDTEGGKKTVSLMIKELTQDSPSGQQTASELIPT
jgi:uncharacterized protein